MIVTVAAPSGAPDEHLAELTQGLRDELDSLPGTDARVAVRQTAPGSKAGAGRSLFELLVSLAAPTETVPLALKTLFGWLTRQRTGTKLRIKMEEFEFELEGDMKLPDIERLFSKISKAR